MQMHEWERQEVLLDKIEEQKVDDVLIYNKFNYEKHEWDNIPGIVPRYIIYLSKYMDGICQVSNEFDSRESTYSVRADVEQQLQTTNKVIVDNRKIDLVEKVEIKKSVTDLNTKTDAFRKTYDEFTQEATKLNEKDNVEVFGKSMDVVISTWGKQEITQNSKAAQEELAELKMVRDQMRMYSFKQMFDMYTVMNNKSEVHNRVCKAEQNIETLFKNVQELRNDDQKLREYTDNEFANVRQNIDQNKADQDEVNEDHSTRIDDNLNNIIKHRQNLEKIHETIKRMTTYQEGLHSSIAKVLSKLENFKADTQANIASVKEDFKERLGDLDKYYSESMEEMGNTIESVRIMARDSVNAKEKELTDLMTKQVKTIQSFVDENIEDMVEERKATLSKYEKQFNQIKLVCCKYFEKYDIELETVQIKAQSVMDKYQDWSKVLIEPASMNDARLFSLESRMHEEEEIRIREYEFLRDLMKKLIYSLEKTNASTIDGFLGGGQNGLDKANSDIFANISNGGSPNKTNTVMGIKSATPILPNLLNNISLQNSIRDNINLKSSMNQTLNESMLSGGRSHSISQPTELMMLKRLNFLRNSLEGHCPKETTQHLREQATQKRDDRIMELWKNDLEKPSVYEMVQNMKQQQEDQNLHSSKFNNMLKSIQAGVNIGDQKSFNQTNFIASQNSIDSIDASNNNPNDYFNSASQGYVPVTTVTPSKTGPQGFGTISGQSQQRWASRPKHGSKLPAGPIHMNQQMSQTLNINLQKGKFQTQADSDFIAQQHKNSKLKPIKQRIQEAEKDKFWSDFQDGIDKGKSRQTQKEMMQATGTSFRNPISDDGSVGLKQKTSRTKAFGDRNQTIAVPSVGLREQLLVSGQKNPTTRGDTMNEISPSDPYTNQQQIFNHHEFDVSLTNQGLAINQSSMTNDFPVQSVMDKNKNDNSMNQADLDSQLNIQENNQFTQSPGHITPISKN